MNCNSSNGRIDILGPNPMPLFDKIPISKNNNRITFFIKATYPSHSVLEGL